jgi:hypothetical protein
MAVVHPLNLPYPPGIFSLSHLAIPFPMDDPLYGMQPNPKTKGDYGFNLGAMDNRGERGALIVDQDFLTRLSSNPFFPYLLDRVGAQNSHVGAVGFASTPRSRSVYVSPRRRRSAAIRGPIILSVPILIGSL